MTFTATTLEPNRQHGPVSGLLLLELLLLDKELQRQPPCQNSYSRSEGPSAGGLQL